MIFLRAVSSSEYSALIDKISCLQQVNFELVEELNSYKLGDSSRKPLEFSQKLIVATVFIAGFVIVATFVLAFLGKDYPTQLVNDIVTLTLTAEGGYFCQNGVRSIFTGDKTITNFSGTGTGTTNSTGTGD